MDRDGKDGLPAPPDHTDVPEPHGLFPAEESSDELSSVSGFVSPTSWVERKWVRWVPVLVALLVLGWVLTQRGQEAELSATQTGIVDTPLTTTQVPVEYPTSEVAPVVVPVVVPAPEEATKQIASAPKPSASSEGKEPEPEAEEQGGLFKRKGGKRFRLFKRNEDEQPNGSDGL